MFEALCGKRRNRAFDGDLVVVVVAIVGVEKPIGHAPRKKRHRHVRTLNLPRQVMNEREQRVSI